MKNRIRVTVANKEYTLVAEEDPEYTKKVAAHLDEQYHHIMSEAQMSQLDAAVLAGLNVTDEYYKELEASENLRRQLKEYLEELNRLKDELSECKREIFKLQSKKS